MIKYKDSEITAPTGMFWEETALHGAEDMFVSVDRTRLPPGLPGQLASHWFALHDAAGGVPPRTAVDPADLLPLLPRVMLLDVLEDDFRYRLIGTQIDRFTAFPYTGRRTSEIPGQASDSKIRQLYVTTLERQWPVVIELPYVGRSRLCRTVSQIAMPLTIPNGSQILSLVAFHLVANAQPDQFLEDHAARR